MGKNSFFKIVPEAVYMKSAVFHFVDQICWLKGVIALGTVFHVEPKKKLRMPLISIREAINNYVITGACGARTASRIERRSLLRITIDPFLTMENRQKSLFRRVDLDFIRAESLSEEVFMRLSGGTRATLIFHSSC